MFRINTLLLLLAFSSSLWACSPHNRPCKAWQMCYPGIGCVSTGSHIQSASVTQSLISCYNVTINTIITPSLRCIGSVPCEGDTSQSCGNVVDISHCYLPPITENLVVERGDILQCPQSLPCSETTGCIGSPPVSPIVFSCCGVHINLTDTPTIQCLNFDSNCSCVGLTSCPQIVDTDLCRQAPVTTPTKSASQGNVVECEDAQPCSPGIGCAPVTQTSPPQTSVGNNDRMWLTIFFVIYGIVAIFTLSLVGFCASR